MTREEREAAIAFIKGASFAKRTDAANGIVCLIKREQKMTDLERALLHIKTRADAWAVKEVEKAIDLDYKTAFKIACALLNGDTLYGMDAESIFSEIMKKDGCVCSLDYENYILTHLNELRDDKALSQETTDKPMCDRNICISNEYNGIGCDECVVNKPQEPCDDAISRDAVKELIKSGISTDTYDDVEQVCKWIDALPPVSTTKNIVNHGTMNISL